MLNKSFIYVIFYFPHQKVPFEKILLVDLFNIYFQLPFTCFAIFKKNFFFNGDIFITNMYEAIVSV